MHCDLEGRIKKCKLRNKDGLYPLFEAVVNSIHAIQDKGEPDGKIQIKVSRNDTQQQMNSLGFDFPIESFKIIDNGIGFNEENFRSFETSDSIYKASRGGKGVGRLLWLVAFDNVEINSVFKSQDSYWERTFDFGVEYNGVSPHNPSKSNSTTESTTVTLLGFKKEFSKNTPSSLEVIAEAILEHCLQYFLQDNPPHIEVSDEESRISINDIFTKTVEKTKKTDAFLIGDSTFKIEHIKLRKKGPGGHYMYLCAHHRSVLKKPLTSIIPNLGTAKIDSETDNSYFYSGYVSGDYLDKVVNPDRNGFDFPEDDNLFNNEITSDTIIKGVAEQIESTLSGSITKNREELTKKIKDIVYYDMPSARGILKNLDRVLLGLKPNADKKTIRQKINEESFKEETEIQNNARKFLDNLAGDNQDIENAQKNAEKIIQEVTEATKDKLIGYVAFRKIILEIFEKRIALNESGKFSKEKEVHELIFPQRKTSDDISYDEHNLWLIDDKLSFHEFLASDIPFESIKNYKIEGKERCDLLIFNNKPFAFTNDKESMDSIAIVEFKRPERDDYTLSDNPIAQVLDYIDRIKEGKARDVDGRTYGEHPNLHFFIYIISDITSGLKKLIKNDGELTSTADGKGYFGYKKNYNAYIEITSFNKLIIDARKRNFVWFKKMGLV